MRAPIHTPFRARRHRRAPSRFFMTDDTLTRRSWLAFVMAASSAACASTQRSAPPVDADLAITHVAIIDIERGRLLPDYIVAIKGDRIVTVAPAARTQVGNTTRLIDGTGRYLM